MDVPPKQIASILGHGTPTSETICIHSQEVMDTTEEFETTVTRLLTTQQAKERVCRFATRRSYEPILASHFSHWWRHHRTFWRQNGAPS